jgi:ABC-type sugar transport system ATPase subunit
MISSSAVDVVTSPRFPTLRLLGVSKSYGHVRALVDLDLDIFLGEVLAIVGDNGAGKSTFVKIISGLIRPDEGSIECDGSPVEMRSPAEARSLGIATVFQDLALIDVRSVAHNIFVGVEPRRRLVFVDRARMDRDAEERLALLHIKMPSVKERVRNLSGGQRQAVAIARALARNGRMMVMDEPTAALGVEQTATVTQLIAELKAQGHGVVIITHNMEHVMQVADRIAVFRHGRCVAVRQIGKTNREEIVGLITGAIIGDQTETSVEDVS